MRRSVIASVVALSTVLVASCDDLPTGVDQATLDADASPNAAVSAGEKFRKVVITNPSRSTYSMSVGASKQMKAQLRYSRGGSLPGVPYTNWMSSDPCVAKVTNKRPSWGKVKGVKAGTALIIASAWGKADTIKVTVRGSGNLDKGCEKREWSWDYSDVSFTGTPAKSYKVRAGERLKKLVLFAPKKAVQRGEKQRLIGEMWYNRGGKLNAARYARFMTTDGSVATIDNRGVVTARRKGRTKVIMQLGQYSDVVPLYVK